MTAPRLPLDDDHAPLFTTGQVAGILGVPPAFLRRLDAEAVIQPARSGGGQRRYTRQEIRDVERVIGLTGEGVTLAGVRRVLQLEARVRELERQLSQLRSQRPPTGRRRAQRPPAPVSRARSERNAS
jgi:MerR family transcriptional regulator, heat shock protein HspR